MLKSGQLLIQIESELGGQFVWFNDLSSFGRNARSRGNSLYQPHMGTWNYNSSTETYYSRANGTSMGAEEFSRAVLPSLGTQLPRNTDPNSILFVNRSGVSGVWSKTITDEGNYNGWVHGINPCGYQLNVVNKFTKINSAGQGGVYDWGRTGNALGAGGIAYGALENVVANKYWWMDASGNYNSTKLLSKGANGKFIQGVQGYRNGYNSALNAASKFRVAGNIVGGLGIGVTLLQLGTNQITGFEASVDAAFGVISFMGPIGAGIGATYFVGKIGYEYFSGNTLFEKP